MRVGNVRKREECEGGGCEEETVERSLTSAFFVRSFSSLAEATFFTCCLLRSASICLCMCK